MKKYPFLLTLLFSCALINTNAQNLKISDNKRYLVTDDGKPFFWLADTGWELFHRLRAGDADIYLKTRAAQGFTVIQAVLLAECDGVTEPTPDGFLPLIGKDVTKPNEEYFKAVDKIIQKAAGYGLYMAILPTWGSHAQDRWHPFFQNLNLFTRESAYKYGKFLGERYRNYWNIVWVLGGDRLPSDTEKIWNELAKGIKEGDGGKHLITYHPEGGHSTVEFYKDFSWLDFHSFQSGHGSENVPVWKMVKEAYDAKPAKPVLNMEPNYEHLPIGFTEINGYFEDYDTRKAAYWSVFSGAFGHTYGHNCVWQMWSPKYKPVLEASISWDKAIFSTASFQMKHLKELMLSLPFLTRIPDQSVIIGNQGYESDYLCATRDGTPNSKDATYIMVYLPIYKGVSINTSSIAAKRIKARWFDPRTGVCYDQGEYENKGTFSPGWENRIHAAMGGPDWVLIVQDAGKNYEL
jgi:hypothetical protein